MILSRIAVASGMSIETLYRMIRSGLMCWAFDLDVIKVVRLFVDRGTDPDEEARFWVAENESVEIVEILPERGSDPKRLRGHFFSANINLEDNFQQSM